MSTSEMKLCPYCGEEIRAVAIRCKHCQMMLDGSGQAAASTAPGGVAGHMGPRGTDGYGGTSPGFGSARLNAGSVIGSGRYELKELLGRGGMGEVFLAEHTYTSQKVAVKAVWQNLMDSEGPRKRFLQEGRLLATLKHPNIVGLTDFFEEDGRFFLVMEYVEGETLAAYLSGVVESGGRVAIGEAKRVLEGVLKGLAHAHRQTPYVVHRDIKPSNVMLAKDGRVVLMDFGIAKVAEGEKITRTAGVVGTYEYMSPEQVAGQGITTATDVYALGILAYELLTGDVPFPQRDDSGFDAMEGHRNRIPPPVEASRPECPAALSAWVAKALAKDPAERYRDAGAMLEALNSGGEQPSERTEPWAATQEPGRSWGGGASSPGPRVQKEAVGQEAPSHGTTREGAFQPVANEPVPQSGRGRRMGWIAAGLVTACVVGVLAYSLTGSKEGSGPGSPSPVGTTPTGAVGSTTSSSSEVAAAEVATANAAAKARQEAATKAAEEAAAKAAADTRAAEAARAEAVKAAAEAAAETARQVAAAEAAKSAAETARQVAAAEAAKAAETARQVAAAEAAKAAAESERATALALQSQRRSHVAQGSYDFSIDKYEVSHDQYMECVSQGNCSELDWYSCINLSVEGREKQKLTGFGRPTWHAGTHPAICVTPVDAARYCRSVGGRLPRMGEWVLAAGGPNHRTYPWGESALAAYNVNTCANECPFYWGQEEMDYGDPYPCTAPVDALPGGASPYGPEQMAGNVWEWVITDSGEPSAKGGAWNGSQRDIGVDAEYAAVNNSTRWNSIGFRCVYDN